MSARERVSGCTPQEAASSKPRAGEPQETGTLPYGDRGGVSQFGVKALLILF